MASHRGFSWPDSGAQPQWLAELRRLEQQTFVELGLPSQSLEDWKYTSLRTLERHDFRAVTNTSAAVLVQPELQLGSEVLGRLVFEAGRFRSALSNLGQLPAGVRVLSLAQALDQPELQELLASNLGQLGRRRLPENQRSYAIQFLNTACLEDGVVICLAPGVKLDRPLEIRLQSGAYPHASAWYPRVLIVAGEHSAVTVLELHLSSGQEMYLSNSVSEISVGESANVQHYKLVREGSKAYHLAMTTAEVGAGASYDNFVFIQGGKLVRNQIRTVLGGNLARCTINGAYTLNGHQHCDTHTLIEHAAASCSSREVYKGTISGQSKAVFQGKILVHPNAQHTDGYQLNRALLLSDQAEINSKPELEIHADDVKCSHGATAGSLDEETLFYLRTRGLGRQVAQNILVEAFLREALNEIEHSQVRDLLLGTLEQELSAGRARQPEPPVGEGAESAAR